MTVRRRHIFAQSDGDAAFALGDLHARERLAKVWGAFPGRAASLSPLGSRLRLWAGILELGDALAFTPPGSALVTAAGLGGAGGMMGAILGRPGKEFGRRQYT